MQEQRKKIDSLLQIRQDGYYNFIKSTNELVSLGVKIGSLTEGTINLPESFNNHLEKYEVSNQEFEWLVEYQDGSILKQFENGVQHTFADIDVDNLKNISWVSNFDYPTDMRETRVIVRLNWETGLFEFVNGFVNQEVRSVCCQEPLVGPRKLILFVNKQVTSAAGDPSAAPELAPLIDQYFIYNRFVLAYEVNGEKKGVVISPNGDINLFR